jgi:hypothetical protein
MMLGMQFGYRRHRLLDVRRHTGLRLLVRKRQIQAAWVLEKDGVPDQRPEPLGFAESMRSGTSAPLGSVAAMLMPSPW